MEKIAIIGSGISGLGAAYLLREKYDVTLYEKNDYYGGHARTWVTKSNLAIDTGFIVFNYVTYPHLTGLFRQLSVPVKKSDMSFGVSINHGDFEYGSKKISSLFAQPKNLFNLRFWRFIKDIIKFNTLSKRRLNNGLLKEDVTLADYLQELRLSDWFRNYYLVAMGAAIWSTPLKRMYEFPALTFIQFFYNHGLLDIHQPIPWYTVDGGSQVYVEKLVKSLGQAGVKFKSAAKKIIRDEKVKITDVNDAVEIYDKVIIATHSDQALAILESPSQDERDFLGAIKYQENKVILHQDASFMPTRKKAWSSWVYLSNAVSSGTTISLSYWMNSLQGLAGKEDYFVTLNPDKRPLEGCIVDEYVFEHPVFDQKAICAQQKIKLIQGQLNTYYCGAYLRYGFHEDGLKSAVDVAALLGVNVPW